MHRIFRRHIAHQPGAAILEVGCGSSVWLPYFAERLGLRVYGIDYSAAGILKARRNLMIHGRSGTLILGDVFAVDRKLRDRFDHVFSLGVVEHFAHPQVVLETFARLVKPGGLLITWAPNIRGPIVRLSTLLNPVVKGTYGPLTLETLVAYQQEAGLELIEAIYTQFADLTLVNLARFSPRARVWISRLFRLVSLPLVMAGNSCGVFLRSKTLCSGMLTVTRRPAP